MATQPVEVMQSNPKITINSDGTFTPDPLTINNGGLVKFEVSGYPSGSTECYIQVTVSFPSQETKTLMMSSANTAGGTIKIGS